MKTESLNPVEKFKTWYRAQLERSTAKIPSACCLSTTGTDGYPNGRFVSLKEVTDNAFVVTGPLNSRKGDEINISPRAALVFWWAETEKQVRVQGDVFRIDTSAAELYFNRRPRDAQIVSWISKQGEMVENTETLEQRFNRFSELYAEKEIPRPATWGGFEIIPIRIEFLSFNTSRFHERILYTKNGDGWDHQNLQP